MLLIKMKKLFVRFLALYFFKFYNTTIFYLGIHDGFQIVMLANRPGFPFLGNDLFGVLGDLFSVHVIENPLPASEIVMLKKYGPGK